MSTVTLDSTDIEQLRYLWTPDLDPLFWPEGRTGAVSAWHGHVPFAHWIIHAIKPRTLVELGTHNGVSYSAFCEAVLQSGLDTRCYAVDTWRGDDHAGYYGDQVYLDLRRFHDERYGSFSELLRCTFDQALPYFSNSTVDLLHIDGLHTYATVLHDFEQWQSKLSESAVVLFHDTNVREHGFGVWRLWEELRQQYPSFEFLHGHGLGVLAIGSSVSPKVTALCSLRDPPCVHTIRQRFCLLGERWSLLYENQRLQGEIAARKAHISSLEAARSSAGEQQLRARAAQRASQARADAANAMMRAAQLEAKKVHPQTEMLPAALPGIQLFYISGQPDSPGNIYRVVRYVEAAKATGAQASWIRLDQVPEHFKEIAVADIVVICRATFDARVTYAADTARRAGATVVFDIDDALLDAAFDPVGSIDDVGTDGLTERQREELCRRFEAALAAADYCTVPTEELATNIRQLLHPVLVLPNGFDRAAYQVSRRAARRRHLEKCDGLVRIGYLGGLRSHQRDFAVAAEAVSRVLRERPHCRLVLFQLPAGEDSTVPTPDIREFPSFHGIKDRIEWCDAVPSPQLPEKIARLDINLLPLEVGNTFWEANSELKFLEAALVDVPTIASPADPIRRAVRDGETGLLAEHSDGWFTSLLRLVDDSALRRRLARAAHNDVLSRYGPLRRADAMLSAIPTLRGDPQGAARACALELHRGASSRPPTIQIPETEIVFETDKFCDAEVTVVVSSHDYAQYVEEALETVRRQTLDVLDLVVVDDASTDTSLSVALNWARLHATRFNRMVVLRNKINAGLGPTRNAGIDAADTPFVLPLDAENRLLPGCCSTFLSTVGDSAPAFAYSRVQKIEEATDLVPTFSFTLGRVIAGNQTDVIVVTSKEAWATVGGYGELPSAWLDFDFSCRLIGLGLWGAPMGTVPLLEYRVDGSSMWGAKCKENTPALIMVELEKRYTWLTKMDPSRVTATVEMSRPDAVTPRHLSG